MQQVNCRNEGFHHFEGDVSCRSDLTVFTSWFNEISVMSCMYSWICFPIFSCCMPFVVFWYQRNSLCLRRIFFALASPVFHAELYGILKEQGDVEISDVSPDAFHCLQKYGATILFDHSPLPHQTACCFRYIYTDSLDAISVANVVDVLAASKKYLMAKLTRYCYGFIQNHIAADNSIPLWLQVSSINRCSNYYCWRFSSIDLFFVRLRTFSMMS